MHHVLKKKNKKHLAFKFQGKSWRPNVSKNQEEDAACPSVNYQTTWDCQENQQASRRNAGLTIGPASATLSSMTLQSGLSRKSHMYHMVSCQGSNCSASVRTQKKKKTLDKNS